MLRHIFAVLTAALLAAPVQAQNIAAAITKQINSIDDVTDKVSSEVELVTLTDYPTSLSFVGLDTPSGFTVKGMTPNNASCTNAPGSKCRQRWHWAIDPGSNCTLNGNYRARFTKNCAPGGTGCTPGPHQVEFTLRSENFCSTLVVNVAAKVAGWNPVAGCAKDVGGGAGGHVWHIGCNAVAGGFGIYGYDGKGGWSGVSGGGTRIAVDPQGRPAIVNDRGEIHTYDGRNWNRIPGAGRDIAIGAGGHTWVIGTNAVQGGYGIHRWSGNGWQAVQGGAVRIAVDPAGNAWVASDAGNIFRWNGSSFTQVQGCAKDLAIGKDGVVWHVGCNAVQGGFGIYRWNGSSWDNVPGGATDITVVGEQPWVMNASGNMFQAK
jgi:hypothetical protein